MSSSPTVNRAWFQTPEGIKRVLSARAEWCYKNREMPNRIYVNPYDEAMFCLSEESLRWAPQSNDGSFGHVLGLKWFSDRAVLRDEFKLARGRE